MNQTSAGFFEVPITLHNFFVGTVRFFEVAQLFPVLAFQTDEDKYIQVQTNLTGINWRYVLADDAGDFQSTDAREAGLG